jgi:hypothetical protein
MTNTSGADYQTTLDAIEAVIRERAGWSNDRAVSSLAQQILAAEPDRCDFDCDGCRE